MINYLFSGIDKENGFNKKQEEYLKKDVKKQSKIVVISSLPNNYDQNDKQLLEYITYFRKIDIVFSRSSMIDKRKTPMEAIKEIKNSDIVFLAGGNPELQMKFILEYDLMEAIKSKNMIIGVSAGSMNQSKRVIYRDDFDNYCLKDYCGLGLVDINIFPHVDLNNAALMEEVNELKHLIPLILLPNDSFVRIENGVVEIIGKYYN